MAWTAPRTWVASEVVTAAHLNAHIRDNMLETAAATATTAGDIVYADAANSMGSRLAIGAAHGLLVSTGSAPVWRVPATDSDTGSTSSMTTSYNPLDWTFDFGGDIEVTVTTGTAAFVSIACQLSNATASAVTYLAYAVSGATTAGAATVRSINYESSAAGDQARFGGTFLHESLTAGSNTFTLQGKTSAGTGTIAAPIISVLPL